MTFAIWFVLILGLLVGILNILPTAGLLPTGIVAGIATVAGFMKAWDFLFPITEIILCVKIIIGYYFVTWAIKSLIAVFRDLRGNNQG